MISTMATAALLSMDEYLQTSYRPDCEYVDGELRRRNVGKWEHARVQLLLAGWFLNHETAWQIVASTEQQMQVSGDRERVPDLVVLRPGPQPDVLTAPPLLVVEILSPDDSYSDTQERASDYLAMGVETVWIVDPRTQSGRMCRGAEWIAGERLEVAGTPVYVDLPAIFNGIGERV